MADSEDKRYFSVIRFEHGKETCAIRPGKFCRFFGSKSLGQVLWCMFFNERLFTSEPGGEGWTMRCEQCLKLDEEGGSDG